MPAAGIATRDSDFDKMQPGTMGGTYGGNAVACAAAVATIQVRFVQVVLPMRVCSPRAAVLFAACVSN